ncbi:DUF7926 domain-containing protein [Actinomyces howellii]|nr:Ig-like domain-containing protein [Actinomyces howellii]
MTALFSPAARAENNPNIVVTLETNPLVLTDHDGTPQPGRAAIVEEPVQMRFSWDASAADPKPGQSFFIALPEEYRFREIGRHDDLVLGNGTKVGDCVTTSFSLTCTFNDAIVATSDLRGSGTQMLMAQKTTATNNGNFDLNGTATTVFHPNNEPIQPIAWIEKNLSKYANSLQRDSSGVTWHIEFSGGAIATHLGTTAGTVSTVTFSDVTGGGQVLDPDLSNWYVRVNPERYGGGADGYFDVARGDGTVLNPDHGTFTLTPTISADGTSASVTLTRTDAPFDPRTNYEIVYRSLAEGGQIVPGKVYTNTATLVGGQGTELSSSMSYRDLISYDVTLTQGFGSFSVKKYATGALQSQVPAGTTVTLNVSYELPQGSTEANFPTWTNKPPSNPYTVQLTVGEQQDSSTLYTFPRGTTVTLTEDTSATTLPSGTAWGSATFNVNGTETSDSVSLTVGDATVTAVSLYNEVVEATPPTPTPTPEPTPTPTTPEATPTTPEATPTTPEATTTTTPRTTTTTITTTRTTVTSRGGGSGLLARTGAAGSLALVAVAGLGVGAALLLAHRRRG